MNYAALVNDGLLNLQLHPLGACRADDGGEYFVTRRTVGNFDWEYAW